MAKCEVELIWPPKDHRGAGKIPLHLPLERVLLLGLGLSLARISQSPAPPFRATDMGRKQLYGPPCPPRPPPELGDLRHFILHISQTRLPLLSTPTISHRTKRAPLSTANPPFYQGPVLPGPLCCQGPVLPGPLCCQGPCAVRAPYYQGPCAVSACIFIISKALTPADWC